MNVPELEWWRTAVVYQIYPRSFADSNGDGIGDLPGITSRLHALAELGVDAIWLSPFYPSPQRDAGYDVADYCDVDPTFGTLGDFDNMLTHAHDLGLRVIVDLVPNHSSSDHAWFQEALAAGPGSEERGRYIFRDGTGPDGSAPPNNWQSCFAGPAWTRVADGQWYLHLFDSSQPDFDWSNRWVRDRFEEILRFWLDRGVDGFRVDVAHGMVKEDGLPDHVATGDIFSPAPFWAQDGVHDIFREWRKLLDEYGDRMMCAEAWVAPLHKLADWVRSDEMNQAFNFAFLGAGWDANRLRASIDESLAAFSDVGAPSTWVLSNHDVVRHATRLGFESEDWLMRGVGPDTPGLPDARLALQRAQALTLLMLMLPGSAYLYQGEELGLPEAVDIPDEVRQDPAWHRSAGERYGRDGCRVPIPWTADEPAYGFSPSGAAWLPQPGAWAGLARDQQAGVLGSTLELYREALQLRWRHDLGAGHLDWIDSGQPDVFKLRNGTVSAVINLGQEDVTLPAEAEVLLHSGQASSVVGPAEAAWISGCAHAVPSVVEHDPIALGGVEVLEVHHA